MEMTTNKNDEMKITKDKQCILCPYKHEDGCLYNHDNCYSLSNIYYGKICKYFPFKQIENFKTERNYKKEEKDNRRMDEKYGNYALEDDDIKFIWGVVSWDDLSGKDANFYTMNDIDIIYDKKKEVYYVEIETAYVFDTYEGECNYLKGLLKAFTRYMDENGLNESVIPSFCMSNPIIDNSAKTIEELYRNFKMFVIGYCEVNKGVVR